MRGSLFWWGGGGLEPELVDHISLDVMGSSMSTERMNPLPLDSIPTENSSHDTLKVKSRLAFLVS